MRFRVAWNRRPVKSAGSCWNDIYEFSVVRAASAECHYAVSLGKNSVVLANTGIYTRVETCSSLAHDDVAGQHSFATESRPFLVLPPAFLCAMTCALFCCSLPGNWGFDAFPVFHFNLKESARVDAGDFELGVILTVTCLLAVMLAAAKFDDTDLVATTMSDDFCID